jgi:hypothetical protein
MENALKPIGELMITILTFVAGLHMFYRPVSWVKGNHLLMMINPEADKANMWPMRLSAVLLLLFSAWNANSLYRGGS